MVVPPLSHVLVSRLKKMPPSMPEYALTRNYLDLMVDLPWNRSTKGERRSGETSRRGRGSGRPGPTGPLGSASPVLIGFL